ncbi:hypothetical protein VTJ83DRAFT_6620 [Remersonia thermophila]|uniref:Kinesin motor domain-containing protein n=1 Tax=Remersonia thermophila TaxID=72144 RepID=A0ABR4D5C1_9PEZI
MASSPPNSPPPARPLSAIIRPAPRSNSRMSVQSRTGGGSRASDEDAKTAVKVAVRVRPPLKPTDPGYELVPQRFQRPMVHVQSPTSIAIDSPQGRKLFVFDRVFSPDVDQAGIWEYLEDCIQAFTQGYNVSLLAYGQSGAGKSYTMGTSGPNEQEDPEAMGVIPRAAKALFEALDGPRPGNPNRNSMSQLRTPSRYSMQPASFAKGEKNWSLRASYVEIYNEQLRDLLTPDHVLPHERPTVTIREDTKGNILLTGLRQVEVNSVEDLMNVLNQGSTLRQTDATAVNARSSRSHAVFSLNLVQRKGGLLQTAQGAEKRLSMPLEALTGSTEALVTTDSKMHFVDLAGSERLKNTGAQGERAKEGISINGGLAALGKVISQLSSRNPGAHVSYRDSKLTRLLQDSLGGNAVTYMIACVTPAEFHLSETLNTVHYAQRARAIQSKPRIQQVEEGDKQAIIDRLKAEVAFLREQIRSAERGGADGRRTLGGPGERMERQSEREIELQNRLLNSEENYKALSERHAMLIAELAKARDREMAESQNHHDDTAGETADERLIRSNRFAQAVDQVVLEYEKTIQSLEHSLASTRATLAITEGNLLEKETRCAYTETINNQLQARLQKLMEREASTESYLHDLEAKLDANTSGEEKNAAIILELRKEIARLREAEATSEEYISTLEERLAEADQDGELMQREIDRLEQVIERQRSLGKLDSLLYELDNLQQDGQPPEPDRTTLANGAGHRRAASRSIAEHSRSQSHVSRHSQLEETIPETGEEDEDTTAKEKAAAANGSARPRASSRIRETEYGTSPAQSKFVADKVETLTQELVDLRVEHETALNELDLLQAKYEEALRALAELQDVVDETRHQPAHRPRDSMLSVASPLATRPHSFLSDSRTIDTNHGTHSSMKSLSTELSSAMDTPATPLGASDADTIVPKLDDDSAAKLTSSEALAAEVQRLKTIAAEREFAERELAERYAQLEEQHQQTLDIVEELKTEVAKAQAASFESVTSPKGSTPVIRRKSSQNVMIIDRAHRSFASLRNIAAENFENNPEVMQNFELNLNVAMHELHSRSERIQELEADVATAKKEMETKMTIISGLTRERSSLKATSPMDMAMVSTLREQLEQSEMRIREMQEKHAEREKELEEKLAELREELEKQTASLAAARKAPAVVEVRETPKEEEEKEAETARAIKPTAESSTEELTQEPATDAAAEAVKSEELAKEVSTPTEAVAAPVETTTTDSTAEIELREKRIAELESELAGWEERHSVAIQSMQDAEAELKKTISELEAQIASVSAQLAAAEQKKPDEGETADAEKEATKEAETRQRKLIDFLRSEIDDYKEIIHSNQSKVTEAEQQLVATKRLLEMAAHDRDEATGALETQKQLVADLEARVAKHEQAVMEHQANLDELRTKHTEEIEALRASSQEDLGSQLAALKAEHADRVGQLEADLTEAREDLMKVATQVAFAVGLDVSVDHISERIDELIANQKKALAQEQEKRAELEGHVLELSNINDAVMRDLEAVRAGLNEVLADEMATAVRSKSPTPITDQVELVKQKVADLETKNEKNSRLVEELEDQLQSNYDQVQAASNRLSMLQMERNQQLEEANAAKIKLQSELETIREEYAALQSRYETLLASDNGPQRSNSLNGQVRKSSSVTSLPSPPPAIPLPPLPNGSSGSTPGTVSPTPRPPSKDIGGTAPLSPTRDHLREDHEARIQLIEKQLKAEKQLTATLEEALTDLEQQQNAFRAECEAWRRRAGELELELKETKEKAAAAQAAAAAAQQQQPENRWSLQQVEEERRKRRDAELARAHLEEKMNLIGKKKKKGSLNCF